MKWYELTEEDRIKKIYSKYSIKQFWNWWDCGAMEVRINDFNTIKVVGKKLRLPYNRSGIYVRNSDELKKVMIRTKDFTKWFGINPRKKEYNRYGNNVFGGTDHNIESINYIPIDIDRKKKDGFATAEQLKNCDIVAEKILEVLSKHGWNKSYMKICSGNGVQLFVKLDVPIIMPECEYSTDKKIHEYSEDFENTKLIIRNGIGKQICKFANKKLKEFGCEVDVTGFRIAQVMALPYSKNFKFGGFRWRGMLDVKDGENEGLSDYILSQKEKGYSGNPIFFKKRRASNEYFIRKGKLREHVLIRFILNNDFPEGFINNTLWFSIKLLLRDSGFDINTKEFRNFHEEIKRIHKRGFSLNIPPKKYLFDPDTVNNYCIKHYMPLVFPYDEKFKCAWGKRKAKTDYDIFISWEAYKYGKDVDKEKFMLYEEDDIFEDIKRFKENIIVGDYRNHKKFICFVNSLMIKYGEDKVKYFFDNKVLEEFIVYTSINKYK